MKLFFSYMGLLYVYIINVTSLLLSITPAINGHKLVYVRQAFLLPLFCFILFSLDARPQSPEKSGAVSGSEIKPLKIGDIIPDRFLNLPLQVENHPEKKKAIALSDYKNQQLIILDFWATWCGTCLEAFPKIAELNRKFKNDLVILPVNGKYTKDNKSKVELVFDRFYQRTEYKLNLPYIWQDSILSQLFEHATIPHLVWLDGHGKVLTFTHAGELNEANIERYLQTREPPKYLKNDMPSFIQELPLSKQLEFKDLGNGVQQSTFTGYIEGVGTESGNYYNTPEYSMFRVTNYPLSYLFTISNSEILSDMKNSQIVFDEKLSTEFVQKYRSPNSYDAYCFELVSTDSISPKIAMNGLQKQLNEYFHVTLRKISKKVPILIMKETQDVLRFRSSHSFSEIQYDSSGNVKRLQRYMIGALLEYLSIEGKIYIDDSNINLKEHLDIDIPSTVNLKSKSHVMDFLRSLGLDVSEKVGIVEFVYFEPLIY
ncbi:TlpA family protein disulfide reductase [Sphingobacterium daejeonense]|uniref:TlpA family protein disulfide reductase n=1 Tax=Sphingobacterium daejeonense TaxID=371142 RepID=UPI0021A6EFCE|nr:TlpA disulfide reductase family protein [Sphingobacterium daejeonense]MCT1531356.1 TlpA family protein disulfide reductase [Sphingobacterium daejeonense]